MIFNIGSVYEVINNKPVFIDGKTPKTLPSLTNVQEK